MIATDSGSGRQGAGTTATASVAGGGWRRVVVVTSGRVVVVERHVPTRRESFVEKRAVCARSVRTRGERERGPGRKLGVSRARRVRGAG